jgi:hypothetical protein
MQDLTADMSERSHCQPSGRNSLEPPSVLSPLATEETSDPTRLTSFAEILERINGVQIGPGATALTRIFRIVPPYRRRVFTYHVRFLQLEDQNRTEKLKDREIG